MIIENLTTQTHVDQCCHQFTCLKGIVVYIYVILTENVIGTIILIRYMCTYYTSFKK